MSQDTKAFISKKPDLKTLLYCILFLYVKWIHPAFSQEETVV